MPRKTRLSTFTGRKKAYLIIQWIRSLSAAGRWKLVKLALTILFLPFVLVWKFTTAGSDCGCCCDEDD
ncbi:MAG TPA: hypothetical protein VMX38_05975 [Verrucomicrobiae bacterium]|nr:hypothetical protein [Verrucomicrobiae bacterium]